MPRRSQPPADKPKPAAEADLSQLPLEERRALTVRKAILPAIAASAAHMEKHISTATVGAYLDDFAQRAGGPGDAVEETIIRQLAQADLVVGQLLAKANTADNALVAQAYGGVACRLLGEIRKLALALKDYRSTDEPRRTTIVHQVTHVEQQNVAERQEVVYSREDGDEGRVSMRCADTEVSPVTKSDRFHEDDRLNPDGPRTRSRKQEAAAPA